MGYILYGGLYLKSLTMMGFLPIAATLNKEEAKLFDYSSYKGFSRTYNGAEWEPA